MDIITEIFHIVYTHCNIDDLLIALKKERDELQVSFKYSGKYGSQIETIIGAISYVEKWQQENKDDIPKMGRRPNHVLYWKMKKEFLMWEKKS